MKGRPSGTYLVLKIPVIVVVFVIVVVLGVCTTIDGLLKIGYQVVS